MKTNYTLLSLILFPLLSLASSDNQPTSNSALNFQQTNKGRIKVEENFLRFFTGDREQMTIDGNGDVRIGSTLPGNSRLKLSGSSSYYMLYLVNDHVDANGFTPLARFQTADITNRGLWVDVYNAGSVGEYLRLGSLGNIPLSILPTGGNLGIGTTNPQYAKVQIKGGATHELLAVNRPDSDVPALYLGNDGTTNAAIASNNSDLTFGRDYAGTYTEYMRLQNSTGRLGIGHNQPQAALDVLSPAVTDDKVQRWQVSDAPADFLEVSNATSANGQFMPALKGYHTTDNRSALYLVGEVSSGNDSGSSPIMTFDSRLSGGPASNRVLFAWDSYGQRRMTLSANGNLHVHGTVTWPDYVFEDTYELNSIEEVEKFIEKNHHLSEIPSATEVKENGVNIVEMQAKLLQKIEELTLYVIELKKENEEQQQRIKKLENQ